MCISCLAYSALTLFLPAPEPATITPSAMVPEPLYSDVEIISAKDTQVAISAMLEELPDSPDMAVMRSELKAIQAELATLDRNADTDSYLNERLKDLSVRVLSSPGADVVIEELMGMLVIDETEPAVKSLSWKLVSPGSALHSPLTKKSQNWGWLK